jgi:NO-binding membrane sensor protein with MHYT domain
MDHFTYGPINPLVAYALSCVGACIGLQCAARAAATSGRVRFGWLTAASLALGGTGIWVMHFVAMLGFTIKGSTIRYDVPMTLASLALAVLVVGIGLALAIQGRGRTASLVAGGLITGLGVAGMHYLGMAAMHTSATIHYDPVLVAASVVIALVAATAALWASLHVRGRWAVAGAVPVMGIAVSGMHYTGMAAMGRDPQHDPGGVVAHGAEAASLLAPLITGISLVTFILLFVVAVWPSVSDLRDEADFNARVARLRSRRVAG